MRDSWTEADVLGLATEEPDTFDRKSGMLLNGDKNAFYDALAKAASAFANSGGGLLVLGVEDDGSFTGLDPMVGRTSMKDWIEQKLPGLLSYPLSLFRVHTVLPSNPSAIPAGKVLVVVDIGDSPAAPHQSGRDRKYYYRAAGRSEPAQHFYLELLRQRLTNPSLTFEADSITPTHVDRHNGQILLEVKVRFRIVNTGRVAAYKWALVVRTVGNDEIDDDTLKKRTFPFFSEFPHQRSRSAGIRIDDTILPGLSLLHDVDAGFLLSGAGDTANEIRSAIEEIICSTRLGMQLATEMSPGEVREVLLGAISDTEELTNFVLNASA